MYSLTGVNGISHILVSFLKDGGGDDTTAPYPLVWWRCLFVAMPPLPMARGAHNSDHARWSKLQGQLICLVSRFTIQKISLLDYCGLDFFVSLFGTTTNYVCTFTRGVIQSTES